MKAMTPCLRIFDADAYLIVLYCEDGKHNRRDKDEWIQEELQRIIEQ